MFKVHILYNSNFSLTSKCSGTNAVIIKRVLCTCLQVNMGTRVYIGGLSSHAREKDVERFFKNYGRLKDIMLKNGYGFVVSKKK